MVRHKLPVSLILHEVSVLWIVYFIAKLRHEFFEKTSTVDSLLSVTMLIDELDHQLILQIELLLVYLIVRILKNSISVDVYRMSVNAVLLLLCESQMLKHFRPQSKWYRMRQMHQQSVVQFRSQLLVSVFVILFGHVLLNDPEVLAEKPFLAKPLISIVKSGDRLLDVSQKFCSENRHRVGVLENPVRNIVENPRNVFNLLEGNEGVSHLGRVLLHKLIIIDYHQSLADDEAEQVQVVFVPLDHFQD